MPYWRLANFYLFYFATLGVLIPYWGLYLRERGFDALAIGEMLAIIMATKIVAPFLWGWVADHTRRPMALVRIGAALALLAFTAMVMDPTYVWMVVITLIFSFFWNAVLSPFEAVTLNHLAQQTHRYSQVRLWGSVGFILAVVLLGTLLEGGSALWLPELLLALFAVIWVVSLLVPESQVVHQSDSTISLSKTLTQPAVLVLLLVCFLAQASHGPYYTFYTIYLEDNGYGRDLIGRLWALGVAAEIGVFMMMHRWLPALGARNLLLLALTLTTLRWVMIGSLVDNLILLTCAQLLHAASFGMYHAAAIHLIHNAFRGPIQGRGQAIYSSVSFGAGGALGSLVSGLLWESSGSAATYYLAAVTSFIALLLVWRGIPRHFASSAVAPIRYPSYE